MPDPESDSASRRAPRRSWRDWLVRAMWVVVLAIFLEYAVRSVQEHEMQAAVIAAIVFGFLLFGGAVLMLLQRIDEEEQEEGHPTRQRDD